MTTARARKTPPETRARTPLRSIQGGEGGLDELFSARITHGTAKKARGKKREIPPTKLPKELAQISDLFAAGKSVLKEVEFKVKYAEQQLRQFCMKNFVHTFISGRKKPPSLDYLGTHSQFKYVYTSRTTLTADKVTALRDLHIPIDEYTELTGIDVNMNEIRRHHLEEKLRDGLMNMGVSRAVLEECFASQHELNPGFYDNLHGIIRDSLKPGEDLEEKMRETLAILGPTTQIRNVQVEGLDLEQAFELVHETEIQADDAEIA